MGGGEEGGEFRLLYETQDIKGTTLGGRERRLHPDLMRKVRYGRPLSGQVPKPEIEPDGLGIRRSGEKGRENHKPMEGQ
jgi:hypothetical protein